MAVIRQRQQVFSKPIGVTRMDTGEAELWKTVKAGADQLTSIAFREGQTIAEETGREAGLALEVDQITGINPETNKREPVGAPAGFGSIARRAYEKVVDARFMDDAQNRLRLKAQELGSKYKRSPAEFAKQMSNFVASTAEETADGKFRSTIIEAGERYLSEMQINLIDQQRTRARGRETELGNYNLLKGSEEVNDLAKSGLWGDAEGKALEQMDKAKDMLDAGLISISAYDSHHLNYKSSMAKGMVETVIDNLNSPTERAQFALYLSSRGAQGKLLGKFANDNKTLINKYLIGSDSYVDQSNMTDVMAFFNSIGNRADKVDNLLAQQQAARDRIAIEQATVNMNVNSADFFNAWEGQVSNFLLKAINSEPDPMQPDVLPEQQLSYRIQSVASNINSIIEKQTKAITERYQGVQQADGSYTGRDPNYSDADFESDKETLRQKAIDSFVLLGISEGNSDRFFDALKSDNYNGLSDVQIIVAESLKLNSNIFTLDDISYVKEFISDNKNNTVEAAQQRMLVFKATDLGDQALNLTSTLGWDKAFQWLEENSRKAGIVDNAISAPEHERQLDRFRIAWSKKTVDFAESRMNSQQLTNLLSFVTTGNMPLNSSGLTEEVGENIRNIAGEDMNKEAVTGHIEKLVRIHKERETQEAEQRALQTSVANGDQQAGNPDLSEKISKFSDKQIMTNVFGFEPSDTMSDEEMSNFVKNLMLSSDSLAPSTIQVPDGQGGFVTRYSAGTEGDTEGGMAAFLVYQNLKRGDGVISQGLVDALTSVVNGTNVSPVQLRTALQHYTNLSTIVNKDGSITNLLAGKESSFEDGVLEKLHAIRSISKLAGTENLTLIASKLAENTFDAEFQTRMKKEYGNGYAFISEHLDIENFSGEAKDALAGYAKYLWMTSSGDIDTIKAGLKDAYKQKFKETRGFVMDSAQTDPNKSMYALHQVFKDETILNLFKDHVTSTLSNSKIVAKHPTTLKTRTFGANSSGLSFEERQFIPFAPLVSDVTAGEVFLHPLPSSSDGAVYYMAMELDKLGNKIPVKTVRNEIMIFSNKEQYILDAQQAITNEQEAEAQELRRQAIKRQEIRQDAEESGALSSDVQVILDRVSEAENKQ